MDVLDEEDDGLSAALQQLEEGGEQGRPAGAAFELAQQRSVSELAGDVIERRQRRGREECVTVALENAGRARMGRDEVLDKGGLADASLAADEREAALSGARCRESCRQRYQIALAFEQCHAEKTTIAWGQKDRGKSGFCLPGLIDTKQAIGQPIPNRSRWRADLASVPGTFLPSADRMR